jgi:hypothetical protein
MSAGGKAEMKTRPSPGTAATVDFSSEVKTVGSSKIRRVRFKVTLFPSSEVVSISGTEYFGAGTRFRIFAENHVLGLRREKKLDDGAIVTLFSSDDRARDTLVAAAGGGLLKVASKSFGPTAGITPGKIHAPVIGSDVSVIDFYKYLSAVGAAEPGRVKEAGFFSHSWPGGPILFNTGDTSGAARISSDFDGRMKDYNAVNSSSWPTMKNAFAANGSLHVWGCSATTHHKNLTQGARANKKAGDNAAFTVTTVARHHDGDLAQSVEERTTRARVKFDMDRRFRSLSYMAAAASALGIPVFGAPPGVGSSFADPKKKKPGHPELSVMFIDTQENSGVYGYFKDEFGPEFSPTVTPFDKGYVDYGKLAKRAPPAAAPFSSEVYQLTKSFDKNPAFASSSLSFAHGHARKMAGTDVTLKISPKSGFATAGKKGHLYELIDSKDATKSQAVFVQEDSRVFPVTRDAAKAFTVVGPQEP